MVTLLNMLSLQVNRLIQLETRKLTYQQKHLCPKKKITLYLMLMKKVFKELLAKQQRKQSRKLVLRESQSQSLILPYQRLVLQNLLDEVLLLEFERFG